MYDICCIGHITLDKVITPQSEVKMPGGTSFYFSNAIRKIDGIHYLLVTALAQKEIGFVDELRKKNIEVEVLPSRNTVYFENIYAANTDYRTQKVMQKADPFTVEELKPIESKVFHIGPLLADDIPLNLIKALSHKGIVSLDVQGYLREVRDTHVCPVDWPDKKEALPYVDILKANESEMEVLTGHKDAHKAARTLAEWGVKEVIITLGSMGSIIYSEEKFYDIPAYVPRTDSLDATGCGDTYMAGFLYQRVKGHSLQESGEFAAAMATLKIETSGPFKGTPSEIAELQATAQKKIPVYSSL